MIVLEQLAFITKIFSVTLNNEQEKSNEIQYKIRTKTIVFIITLYNTSASIPSTL